MTLGIRATNGRFEPKFTSAVLCANGDFHAFCICWSSVKGSMDKSTVAKIPRIKTWTCAIFISASLFVWLSGMTAGLMAGGCRNDRYEGAKKLRFCNISLTAGSWMKFSSLEQAKGAIIQLERGIALSQIGETAAAIEAFEKALRDANAKSGPWERELHQRMVQIEDYNTLALWVSVIQSDK